MNEHERRFELFGSEVRILIGPPAEDGLLPPEVMAATLEAYLRDYESRLTRFDPASELSRLNADPRRAVPVSPLLGYAVQVALQAAERSGGLVDPVVLDAVEQAGYQKSRAGRRPGPLAAALAWAPPRRPAAPAPHAFWQQIRVDGDPPMLVRPAGTRIDLGGVGKGLAADIVATRLPGYSSFAVDAGGDVRIGGAEAPARLVEVVGPFVKSNVHSFELRRGAVATSGLRTRIWQEDTGFSHHLIDPSTGQPAWTGVIQATAVAPTAVAAETLAKAALLAGPDGGRALLEPSGGVLVLDSGEVVVVGAISAVPASTAGADLIPEGVVS